MRILIAGGSGALGRRLIPQLIAHSHTVIATTSAPANLVHLNSLGARAALMDGLDAGAVGEVVARAEPDVVVHQMTALPATLNLRRWDKDFARTNELRIRGTDNLLTAADAVGVRRFAAQSFTGWPSARMGGSVKTETDPLDPSPPAAQRKTLEAIRYLERAVRDAPLDGIVLRYGSFYGRGTSMADEFPALLHKRRVPIVGDGGGVWSFIHLDDAAAATVAALEQDSRGIYNVVDDDPAPAREWITHLAACVGAPPPRRVPTWLTRIAVGETGVSMMTQIRGSSNARARQELGWEPRWASWREGFREALGTPHSDSVGPDSPQPRSFA
jgi:nucleoside-diphosphate-sugar epimerase